MHPIFISGICLSLMAATEVQPEQGTLALIERYGVMAVLLTYFIIRDYLRGKDDRLERLDLVAQIRKSETYVRETLSISLQQVVAVVAKNSNCLKDITSAINNCPHVDGRVREPQTGRIEMDRMT